MCSAASSVLSVYQTTERSPPKISGKKNTKPRRLASDTNFSMTLSAGGIEGRKIDAPLGARQPERLAHRALGEGRDARGVQPLALAVERVQPDQSFDPARDHRHFFPGGLRPPHHFTRGLADERRTIEP